LADHDPDAVVTMAVLAVEALGVALVGRRPRSAVVTPA